MDSVPDDTRLGDYRLKELLAEGPVTRTWLAEQVSVRRIVLVDELRTEAESHRDSFLADIRAKAAVDHPLIGSVYEAVANDRHCFFARERLAGATLGDRLRADVTLRPATLANLLRRVAEANLHLENRGQDCAPLDADDIHLEDSGVVRLVNLAVAGERDPDRSRQDIVGLGQAFPALVADGHSGATRILTLLAWMRGENLDAPITWDQTRSYASQIEQQLADPLAGAPSPTGQLAAGKKLPLPIFIAVGALAIAAIGIGVSKMKTKVPPPPPKPALPEAVSIPGGSYPTPDGAEEKVPAFKLEAHEVTIGQYAGFLDELAVLADGRRERLYDDPSQPETKTGHLPDDWTNLHAAAKANGMWQNLQVTLDTPVVGIDWWDAMAYCSWKKGELPTQEEWFAALRHKQDDPTTIKPSKWIAVTPDTPDRTSNGLLGMAGSVAEWTRTAATNPANPLGEKQWVIIGGSYLRPINGANTREWVDDRALRRTDLGFRLLTEAK